MKNIVSFLFEKFKINSKTALNDKKANDDETIFVSPDGNIKIEYATEETSNNIVRIIYKDKKMVKYWFEQDTVQTSILPNSSDVIQEYTDIFN